MLLFIWIFIILIICLCSILVIYLLIHSRLKSKSPEHQQLRYSIQPSINIITKRLSICPSSRSSKIENLNQIRSHSLANNLFIKNLPSHRRQSAIIDSKQIAQIEFSLPPTPEKYRRRSVAICNNIIQPKYNTLDSLIKTIKCTNDLFSYLISFSINYNIKCSQIQIEFYSLLLKRSLQQLTIKIKLIPDGKLKYIERKNILENENVFSNDNNQQDLIQFSNIAMGKLLEKAIVMKIYGKDQMKKNIQFGQIGKIYFNQLKHIQNETTIDFLHEVELIKLSSIEILVLLEQNNDHSLIVDIQRVKGLKFDQKNPNGSCFFQIILLDRHRPLSTQQTKINPLNSSAFSLDQPCQFNILAFNPNNLDRIMIMIKFYTNLNSSSESQCIARVKIASVHYCSGTGTIHWQQFKERKSFSMWHTLIKQ